MSSWSTRKFLILVYPRCHFPLLFSAGRPIDRSVDSITLKEDLVRDRWHNDNAAIHEPDTEGNVNNGGRMYNSMSIFPSSTKQEEVGQKTTIRNAKSSCHAPHRYSRWRL